MQQLKKACTYLVISRNATRIVKKMGTIEDSVQHFFKYSTDFEIPWLLSKSNETKSKNSHGKSFSHRFFSQSWSKCLYPDRSSKDQKSSRMYMNDDNEQKRIIGNIWQHNANFQNWMNYITLTKIVLLLLSDFYFWKI